MSGDWVILGTFSEEYKAVILEAALKEDEIPSVIIDRKDSAYCFMGQVELYVKKMIISNPDIFWRSLAYE